MIKQAYIDGFMRKCSEYGIDGQALIKSAQISPWSLPPPGVNLEDYIEAVGNIAERQHEAQARRDAAREAKRTEQPAPKPAGTKGSWFDRQAKSLSDAFASSWLVNNTGRFGKNLGWTYTPSAMVRENRRQGRELGTRLWNSMYSGGRRLSDYPASLWNKARLLKTIGRIPEELYPTK